MENAKIWIENNPETGSIKPFEIFWQIGNGPIHKLGSCKTQNNAEKSVKSTIKRNKKWFNIEAGK